MKRWRFDRYHRGALMAQGAEVSAETEDEARAKARNLFCEHKYQNDKFVLAADDTLADALLKARTQGE